MNTVNSLNNGRKYYPSVKKKSKKKTKKKYDMSDHEFR